MKLLKILSFAGTAVLLGISAASAQTAIEGDPCRLIAQLSSVFKTLRTLAFVGAAFVLAGWAWTFISAGYGAKDSTDIEAAKKKGIGFFIGFALLLTVGLVVQYLPGFTGCSAELNAFGR